VSRGADRATPPLRTHQARALTALDAVWDADRRRAWVVLPPGAGKTRVGLETIAAALGGGTATHVVVLAPNTAIQAQWVAAAAAHQLPAGTSRDLAAAVTCLTYQSLAVFDADDEVADDPDETPRTERGSLLDRLHPNGAELVENMRNAAGLLLVLDECHHLLEVWGRLLGELLHSVEDARVLGLTATPPGAMNREQAVLVEELFGEIAFRAGVPAVVKEGHLAPFAELAWLTTPTAHETEWLAAEATRFTELTTYLTDPTFGSLSFLEWITARFVEAVPQTRSWAEVVKAEPDLADAALRMCHAGLLAVPEGARLNEQHRRAPGADDWVDLLDDWMVKHVTQSDDARDLDVVEKVRHALPAVGYVWTRRGIRRGRSPVDRVLARSQAKTIAAVEIVTHELSMLGARTRMLVLCDHERASSTLPTGLQGVLDQQSGSAYATLEALVADLTTATLGPLMVTGSTVAGHPDTLAALAAHAEELNPRLVGKLYVEGEGPVATLTGGWSSRHWVGPVTSFFEAGHCQVLVGTRGLLGEGWDARRISGLIDLTTATTLTAVVQTRGRALRTDPTWDEKVAVNWSVVCVSETHPKGGNDWDRLVRKHEGFHGVDDDGDIVDGVGHIDAAFSPYAPPPVAAFEDINARMRATASQRDEIRSRWEVGKPYRDQDAATLRVHSRTQPAPVEPAAGTVIRLDLVPPPLVLTRSGVTIVDANLGPGPLLGGRDAVAAGLGTVGLLAGGVAPLIGWYALTGVGAVLAGAGVWAAADRSRSEYLAGWVADQVALAAAVPSVGRVAAAVADALCAAELTAAGSGAVVVEVHPGGEHRCRLEGPPAEAELFAVALDEALAPMGIPRYVMSRYTLTSTLPPRRTLRTRRAALKALRHVLPETTAWHQVPTVLGVNGARAAAFANAWRRWVGDGDLLFTGSAEGAGVLAAQQGSDPFDATTVMRHHWV
jgi:superfamily II DNA or RNA helicase